MPDASLEDRIQRLGNPAQMLRNAPAVKYPFLYAGEYSSWTDEQEAWRNTAVFFDQSHHMTDVYFKGPDVKRLFSDVGVNSMVGFGRNKAKQFVACNHDGYFIGDGILFGLEDDEYSLVGGPLGSDWVVYHAETGGYDVSVTKDPPTAFNPHPRLMYRYQVNGPKTQAILEKAHGGPIDHIKFFTMAEFTIAGKSVRALNHTMAGVPGLENTGLELMGPAEDGPTVLNAILEAGREFGLRRGGARSYLSTARESGWIPLLVPAIYTGEQMAPYRRWLSPFTFEGNASLEGSFASDDIEDYYATPWALGYGNLIKFDHEFIGRAALERLADQPHRKKVWLRWNNDDVLQVISESLFGSGLQPRVIDMPNAQFGTLIFDKVLIGDRLVGLSTWGGYSVNHGQFLSLAMIDEADAQDGVEVTFVWGQDDGGKSKPFMPEHVQATIRATISTRMPG